MPEEIAPNVWRLNIPLPNSPLKNLNSYLIRQDGKELLIDTGFRMEECRAALCKELETLHVPLHRLDIYLTHMHADHAGLAPLIAGPESRVYISRSDGERLRALADTDLWERSDRAVVQEGWPPALLSAMRTAHPGRTLQSASFDRYTYVEGGDLIPLGSARLQVIATPGHTPGHTCLYWPEREILFLGDHVLYQISPNITRWYGSSCDLEHYLESLRQISALPVRLALAAHRSPTGNLRERIDALLAHHERRLDDLFNVVQSNPGITAYDAAAFLHWNIHCRSWEDFPLTQKWFATGEVIAHMEELMRRQRVSRAEEAGIHRYFAL